MGIIPNHPLILPTPIRTGHRQLPALTLKGAAELLAVEAPGIKDAHLEVVMEEIKVIINNL